MTHTAALPAPVVDRRHIDYVLSNPTAVVVMNLHDGAVYFHTNTAVDPFESTELLVLLTFEDVMAYSRDVAKTYHGKVTAARIAKAANLDFFAMHARGEFPTIAEIEAVIAEMRSLQTHTVLAFRKVN